MTRANRILSLALGGALAVAGCAGQATSGDQPASGAGDGGVQNGPDSSTAVDTTQLGLRQLNYGLALRTASIKLVGDLPSLDDMHSLQVGDPKVAYEKKIDAYLADARFNDSLIAFFRNSFKMGGALPVGNNMSVSLETAPTFAAEVVVKERPFWDVLTSSGDNCTTYDEKSATFTDMPCGNNAPSAAGVLTDPGVQAQFVSNFAFRRTRWVQETFDCRKFPTEYTTSPVQMGAGQYTSPWPFDSITGGPNAAIDFHDTKSVVCANCHSTMNHIAPLFANFDDQGMWQSTIQVTVPVQGLPKAKLTDWLPDGELTSWRFGNAVSSIPALGAAMSKDPEVASCMVVRAYDWAMSKDDVVTDLATVPDQVLAPYLNEFQTSGYSMKKTLRAMFTSDDFVKF